MPSPLLSRRNFLKLMGAGIATLALGKLIDFSGFKLGGNAHVAKGEPASPWTIGPLTTVTPVHAALIANGKIISIAGSGYHASNKSGPFQANLIDPDTGNSFPFTMTEDLFCNGLCHLANGNVLIAGGTLQYDVDNSEGLFHGLSSAYEFDNLNLNFQKVSSMAHGRWYPTLLVLPDGKVMVVDGLDEYGTRNALVEIYNPPSRTFSIKYDPSSSLTYCVGQGSTLPGAGSPCYGGPNNGVSPITTYYPRMHVMPSGLVLVCGMANTLYIVNPNTGTWTNIGQTQYPRREYGVSFLLPLNNTASERGKVLIAGGQTVSFTPDPATPTAEMIDFNQGTNTTPAVRSVPSMNFGRVFGLPVILPTGKLVIFGGVKQDTDNYIHTPEMFDPLTETWSSLPDANVSRTYHSVALLLGDGRVWLASGTPDRVSWEHRTEFYNPPYYFDNNRPVINGIVTSAPYGGTIRIPTQNGSAITSVSLVRLMATTHHYDANARLVWLQITGTDSAGINVSAPINSNVAPPGHYMIHIINGSGVPSVASMIKIPA